ncbi:MAG TPA: universal stress protein [Acidimicrobiales bacterium]|jgi:nucleotide-binding universal stress UspA family protein|nr:universal stress protein [Acidimicrobiales bacterium]
MFSRILLAVDGRNSGDVAVDFATAIARDSGATVRVVHVNELIVGGRGTAYESESESMEIVDRAVATLRRTGIGADGVHYLANCFAVGQRIAEAAQEWGADAIVFGSNRRRRWSRLRGAGLRERVTALTGLPVLTAPAPLEVARGVHTGSLDQELAQLVAASAAQ